MKEDNISQLGDYDAPFCEQQYTHASFFLFVQIQIIWSVNTPPPPPPPKVPQILDIYSVVAL